MSSDLNKKKGNSYTFLYVGMMATLIQIFVMVFSATGQKLTYGLYISLFLWVLAIILWISGLLELKKSGKSYDPGNYITTTRIVTNGIFRFVRHPQYLAYILFNLGIIFKVQSIPAIVCGTLAIVLLFAGMKEEEKLLIRRFGDQYHDYKKKTFII